ncbi:MAG: hypothetical protein R3D85_13660 [Paracoccaceae bacterium]
MKLAIAAFATTLALASGASAMVGTYERAVDSPTDNTHLFTMGESQAVRVSDRVSSPEADWNASGKVNVTVFKSDATLAPQPGAYGR